MSVWRRTVGWLAEHLWLPVLMLDLAVAPGIGLCRWLSDKMLAGGKPCNWTRIGAQCGTCGGTHCVQSFLQGAFAEAFRQNPMVFCWILYAIVSGLLLNVGFVLGQKWAVTALKKMYSMSAFYVALAAYILFMVLRNLPLFLSWIG